MMVKKVLVTGAATGFGRGVAWALSERGHKVIAGCQIWPQVWELRNAVLSAGIEMQVIKLDVLNEIDRKHALAIEIDVLFNNAGIMESGPIIEIPMSVFRSVFETNVFAALELAQGFARVMVQRGSGGSSGRRRWPAWSKCLSMERMPPPSTRSKASARQCTMN